MVHCKDDKKEFVFLAKLRYVTIQNTMFSLLKKNNHKVYI